MMTVSNGSGRDSCPAHWSTNMSQKRNSKEDFNAINISFPPPSLINTSQTDAGIDAERRKKKEKKWSLGGLFRRKKAKGSDTDTSSPTEEEEKKGFLERRRSARKKRNRGSKDVTGSFEHVLINRNSNVSNLSSEKIVSKEVDKLSARSSHESLSKKQDSHLLGSSASLEGSGSMRRSGRMKVMARVEASRDRLRADSSSDEGGSSRSRHSISSTQQVRPDENFGSKDSSLNRKSRAARTERYIKRLSKDEEGIKAMEQESLGKVSRSEERLANKSSDVRIATGNKWTAKVVYYESSDYETKYTAKTRSATPSPIHSPKVRPKNMLHQTTSAPSNNMYTTFPPHSREVVLGSHQELRSNSFQNSAFHRITPKSSSMQKVNEYVLPKLPKSKSDASHRPLMHSSVYKNTNWDQKLPGTKSASFDSNINMVQPHSSDPNILFVQFPISRPNVDHTRSSQQRLAAKQNPPPPPPRDPQRRVLNPNGHQPDSNQRPMSYAFESRSHSQQPKLNQSDYNINTPQPVHLPLPMAKHHRSSSDQQLLPQMNYIPRQSPPTQRRQLTEPAQPLVPQHYQYYTDQHPRSRKPIHISYHPQPNDQPYLSDSQMVVRPPYQQVRQRPVAVQNATEFWKQKEQEMSHKMHVSNNSPKVIQKHLQTGSVHRSNSGNIKQENSFTSGKLNLPPIIMPIRRDESTSSLSGQSDVSPSPRLGHPFKISHNEVGLPLVNGNGHSEISKKDSKDLRPLSMVLEKSELSEHESGVKREKSIPPAPPVRRYSKQSSVPNNEADSVDETTNNRRSSNLEEALNELEAIYKSLRLGEEDLLEKAEQREQLAFPDRLDPKNWNAWVQSRGFESDSSFNYSRSSLDSVDSPFHKKIKKHSKTTEPDRVADDMAYRRLNKKDRPTSQEHEVISQAGSFLLVSPTLSPPPFAEAPPIPTVKDEPDITLDDVVYRNIKHVNNTLKVLDPQPPFGIPLGPISPAPNSDYLHITPKERYKSSFKPKKIPDVVTDDLAFRNLRKDSSKDVSLFTPEDSTLLDVPNIKKKRAIRSLSANLLGIIQKESYTMALNNNNSILKNNNDSQNEFDKSQSITNLQNMMHSMKSYNKENVVGSNVNYTIMKKHRCFSEDESEGRLHHTEGAFMGANTSTETLTDSRANLQTHEAKTRTQKYNWLNKNIDITLPPTGNTKISTAESNREKDCLSPSRSISTPTSSRTVTPERRNKESDLVTPVTICVKDTSISQTEKEMLADLAKEAHATSEQLDRELKELNVAKKIDDGKHSTVEHGKSSLLGKVVHHKPVRLNTFHITEDKTTTVSTEAEPADANKSMSDLLKELTRSLDNDFGVRKTKDDNENTKETESIVRVNVKPPQNNEEQSEDSNSESLQTICKSASSLTALSTSPLRLSPIRRSKENVSQSTAKPTEINVPEVKTVETEVKSELANIDLKSEINEPEVVSTKISADKVSEPNKEELKVEATTQFEDLANNSVIPTKPTDHIDSNTPAPVPMEDSRGPVDCSTVADEGKNCLKSCVANWSSCINKKV